MKRSALQITAAVVGFATALAAFNLLKRCDSQGAKTDAPVIGRLTSVEGQVERRLPGSAIMETVPSPRPIFHQDMIVTQGDSSASLVLEPDGPTLRLNENSRLVVEKDTTRPGAFIATLLEGTITPLNSGRAGFFRLFRDGKEVSLDSLSQQLVPVIPSEPAVAASPTVSGAKPPVSGIVIQVTQLDESVVRPTPTQSAPGASEMAESGAVLTNEEILRTLRGQYGLFQRCYLSYIHRQKSGAAATGGTMQANFTIQTSGKINDAKIAQSDFKDTTLHNCVTEVIERTRFKAFEGAAVPVERFPISLQ